MDTDDIRIGQVDLVVLIEVVSRLGAVLFLFLIVALLLRARRKSQADIWIGLVFGSWLLAIAYSALRWFMGKPPAVLPPAYYVMVFILEIVAAFHMLRESNRTLALRKERERERDLARDLVRDPARDLDRDPARDLIRDPARDVARDAAHEAESQENP